MFGRMMPNTRFIFAGNRFFVLKEMLDADLNVQRILAVKNSHLERELALRRIDYSAIGTRGDLISNLRTTDFEYFVANGCPYIVPIAEFDTRVKHFINIHPSYLPDLRGADPVPGALLFGRDAGATCHLMDEGIDTGPIISQVRIPYSDDLDAGLLYQLSFQAEQEVFRLALARNFVPLCSQAASLDAVYYTKKPGDLRIDFSESAETIVRRIRAFGNKSQGAFFLVGPSVIKVYDAEIVTNPYILTKTGEFEENAVVLAYENNLLIRKAPNCLKLKNIVGDTSGIMTGSVLM
jgi:methionyl-tRNA formyltransferase